MALTNPAPDSGILERLRRVEADVVRHDERLERIEQADQQDVIVEKINTLNDRVTELTSQVKWLSRTLYTIGGLATLATAIITGTVGR